MEEKRIILVGFCSTDVKFILNFVINYLLILINSIVIIFDYQYLNYYSIIIIKIKLNLIKITTFTSDERNPPNNLTFHINFVQLVSVAQTQFIGIERFFLYTTRKMVRAKYKSFNFN